MKQLPQPPWGSPVVDQKGMLTKDWLIFFKNVWALLNQALTESDASAQGRDL